VDAATLMQLQQQAKLRRAGPSAAAQKMSAKLARAQRREAARLAAANLDDGDDLEGDAGGAGGGDGGAGGGKASRPAGGEVEAEGDYLLNMGEIFLEQDWFYISSLVADAGGGGGGGGVGSSGAGGTAGRSAAGARRGSGDEDAGEDACGDGAGGGAPGSGDGPGGSGSGTARGGPGGAAVNGISTANASIAMLAPDSSLYVRQDADGVSGGNRRMAFLQQHVTGLAGPFKVERRGIFRVRLLQTAGPRSHASAAGRDDEVALRARTQLRASEKLRLGEAAELAARAAAASGAAAAFEAPPGGAGAALATGPSQPDRPLRGDASAAANMARHLREHRRVAAQAADAAYLSHEAVKFGAFEQHVAAQLAVAHAALAADAASLQHMADVQGAAAHASLASSAAILPSHLGGRRRSTSPPRLGAGSAGGSGTTLRWHVSASLPDKGHGSSHDDAAAGSPSQTRPQRQHHCAL
jgi:hypothetical protein